MVASGVAQRFDLFLESLWASDQPVAETTTLQHTTFTIDKQTNIHAPGGI